MSATAETRRDFPADMPLTIGTAHLFDMRVHLASPQVIPTPEGLLLVAIAQGGWFEGARVRGEVLPGGGDWIRVGSDGVARLDVRATLRTDDNQLVSISTVGIAKLGDAGVTRYWSGEPVTWQDAYIRGTISFQTGSEKHAFLNELHTVTVMQLSQQHVDYRVFAIE